MHSNTIAGPVLIDVALVIFLGRVLAPLASRLGQPPVMAEIFVGIALGPSVFGALAPGAASTLFRPDAIQMLAAIGSIGLVLFMFFVGLELDLATRCEGRVVGLTAAGAIGVPALGGATLYAAHAGGAGAPGRTVARSPAGGSRRVLVDMSLAITCLIITSASTSTSVGETVTALHRDMTG